MYADALKPARHIVQMIADYYGITEDNLLYGNREWKYSEPRHITAYCLHNIIGMSYNTIASMMNKKSHRTIIYAVAKVSDWVECPRLNKDAVECIQYICNHMQLLNLK